MKPADIHIRAIEFFSIWLPGALLAAALIVAWESRPVPPAIAALLAGDPARWVAFALLSYALGHFIFLAASRIDRPLYDRYRTRKWPRKDDDAYLQATAARHAFFGTPFDVTDDKPMNTFAWSKAMLLMKFPAACAEVEQFEADSKFFRSLIVVLPLVGILLGPSIGWWLLPVLTLFAYAAFLRYAERRYKSTEWAYRYVLVAGRLADKVKPAGSA